MATFGLYFGNLSRGASYTASVAESANATDAVSIVVVGGGGKLRRWEKRDLRKRKRAAVVLAKAAERPVQKPPHNAPVTAPQPRAIEPVALPPWARVAPPSSAKPLPRRNATAKIFEDHDTAEAWAGAEASAVGEFVDAGDVADGVGMVLAAASASVVEDNDDAAGTGEALASAASDILDADDNAAGEADWNDDDLVLDMLHLAMDEEDAAVGATVAEVLRGAGYDDDLAIAAISQAMEEDDAAIEAVVAEMLRSALTEAKLAKAGNDETEPEMA